MSSPRIDVSIEHRDAPGPPAKPHPNTCPKCDSHYRDDELDANLWVCPQCGHHFPMSARARIASLADPVSFVEEAADVRSEDPLHFFDLRPYAERLAAAEPNALMSFAGPRVVQQTTREKLPDDFGLSESNFRFGHLDAVLPRSELKPYVARLLRLFSNNGD